MEEARKIEQHFPKYDIELIQRIREWMEEGRYKRYKRYTRSLDEAIIEQSYFIILKLLEIEEKIDQIQKTLNTKDRSKKNKKPDKIK